MKATYRQLLDDHEAIERAARDLLADLKDGSADAAGLASQLEELARVVEDHIGVEDDVVRDLNDAHLSGPWIATWEEGRALFDRLKADWTVYLQTWDRSAIERDRSGFKRASEAILSRLRDRVQQETTAFYATALQTGAIELR